MSQFSVLRKSSQLKRIKDERLEEDFALPAEPPAAQATKQILQFLEKKKPFERYLDHISHVFRAMWNKVV